MPNGMMKDTLQAISCGVFSVYAGIRREIRAGFAHAMPMKHKG